MRWLSRFLIIYVFRKIFLRFPIIIKAMSTKGGGGLSIGMRRWCGMKKIPRDL